MYPLKSKEDFITNLQRFNNDIDKPGSLVSDWALGIKSELFSELGTSNGIKREFSATYTTEKTAKSVRARGTVSSMARCVIVTAGLPKQFWPFALPTAVCLKNQSIHSAHGKTPFRMFHGSKRDPSHLHVFGCKSFQLNEVRKHLD